MARVKARPVGRAEVPTYRAPAGDRARARPAHGARRGTGRASAAARRTPEPVATATDPVSEPGETTASQEPTPTEDRRTGAHRARHRRPPRRRRRRRHRHRRPPPRRSPPAPTTSRARARRHHRPPRLPPAPPPPPVPPVRPPAPGSGAAPPPSPLGVQVTTERRHAHRGVLERAEHGDHPAGHRQQHRHDRAADPALVHAAGRADRRRHEGLHRRRRRRRTAAGPGQPSRASGSAPCSGCGSTARAWKQMPLSRLRPGHRGRARSARREASDDEGFAVLFPPGPPVPGIALAADEVAFDISGAASTLDVRLGNTGEVDAAGRVEVVLPRRGDSADPPAGCAAVDPTRTRCDARRGAGRADRRGAAAGGGDAGGAAGSAAVRRGDRSARPAQRRDPAGADELPDHRGGRAGHAGRPAPAPTGSQGVLPPGATDRRTAG